MSDEKTPKRSIARAAAAEPDGRPVVALYLIGKTRFGRGGVSESVMTAGDVSITHHEPAGAAPYYVVKTRYSKHRIPESAVINEVMEGAVR